MTDKEFDDLKQDFKIIWVSENKFYERMNDEQLQQSIAMFRDIEEIANKGWVSKEFLYKRVLKMSQEEIEEMQKQIKAEKSDSLYKDIKLGDPMDNGFGNGSEAPYGDTSNSDDSDDKPEDDNDNDDKKETDDEE